MIVSLIALVGLQQQVLNPSPLFSDSMVLQRDFADPVFGTGKPGDTVSVTVAGQSQNTKVMADGKWLLRLNPMPAGGPFELTIHEPGTLLTFKDVMVGEVWVCSGQSNMERPEYMADDYAQAQEQVDPAIRMFTVSKVSREKPALEVHGKWIPSSKTTVGGFSAVALAFGRELHAKLQVPVGLIQSSWGATKAEAWTSRDSLSSNEALRPIVDNYLEEIRDFDVKQETYRTALHKWIAARSDTGNEGYLQGWAQPRVIESDWKAEKLPGTIDTMEPQQDGKPFEGAVWFRRTFEMPDAWQGKALKLELGPIRDYDDTYFDGTKVGTTKEVTNDPTKEGRVYRVSPGIPVHGTNTIAIRVFSAQGVCGFTGMPDQMRVMPVDGDPAEAIPLSGTWLEKIERKVDATEQAPHMPLGPGSPAAPGGLFNGMIAPLIPYGIKGFIWYQGESNTSQAAQYRTLFLTLIKDWRQRWPQNDLPFYFVQLANFHPRQDEPGDSDWAELRESQAFALKLPHTGMAVTIDIGDATTIHPTNKKEVGRRLSLIALSRDYGIHEVWSSPEYQNMVASGSSIRVFFKHAEEGLKVNDARAPTGFAIAGEDRKFYWATATIQGNAIVLSSPSVPKPVAVRYAWADNPDCNVYNTNGLPLVPFRSDKWPKVESK